MIKRILVGLGVTPYTAVATRRAIELAQRHGAELTGVTMMNIQRLLDIGPIPTGSWSNAQKFRQDSLVFNVKRAREVLDRFEHACVEAGVSCRVEAEIGNPFDLVISRARYHDLVVFGLRSLFDYGLVNEPHDVLVRLISHGVRPIFATAPKYHPIQRVLIAYSGSMEAAKAMKHFVQFNPWPDASLQIICFEKKRDEAMHLLEAAADYCRAHGFDPEVEYVPGSARAHLLSCAREHQADLIVMGNSSRTLWFHHLLGDTMLHAIQHADQPLFLSQ